MKNRKKYIGLECASFRKKSIQFPKTIGKNVNKKQKVIYGDDLCQGYTFPKTSTCWPC